MARVFWHMTSATFKQYKDIFKEMRAAAEDNDKMRYQQAYDNLCSLPGRPNHHATLDQVVPVIDDVSTRIVTVGNILPKSGNFPDEIVTAGLSNFIHTSKKELN